MAQTTDWIVLAVTALTGGAAGAFITQFIQRRITRFLRPRLSLVFQSDVDGCDVPVPPTQRFFRLKVINNGRSVAENVNVSITRLTFTPEGESAARTFQEEVLDLQVSLTGDYPFRLPTESHRFMDVCYFSQPYESIDVGFAFRKPPSRLLTYGFGAGSYSAQLLASADDADSKRAEIKWVWDGTLDGACIVGLGRMG